LPLENLKKTEIIIGIAFGKNKVNAIRATLAGRIINCLITVIPIWFPCRWNMVFIPEFICIHIGYWILDQIHSSQRKQFTAFANVFEFQIKSNLNIDLKTNSNI
jgi:hypothetical protein